MKRFNLLAAIFITLFAFSAQMASAASFKDLTNYQKQKYWQMLSNDCQPLLLAKKYPEYRTCALDSLDKASKFDEAKETWCNDSDNGMDFFTKGTVTSDLYPKGKADYSYAFSNGKTYVMEGACNSSKKYYWIQKNCAELGNYKAQDGVCVIDNHVPEMIMVMNSTEVNEGEEYKIYLHAADKDGDSLEISAENLPEGSTFDNDVPPAFPLEFGSKHALFTWTPGYQQAGEYEITFKVSDGKGGEYSLKAPVTVKDVNTVPELMIVMNSTEVNEGEEYKIYLYATDKDDDTLEFSAENLPEGSVLDKDAPVPGPIQEGTQHAVFTWIPGYQQAGEYEILFKVSDGKGGEYSLKAPVSVKDVDQSPGIEWEKRYGEAAYDDASNIKQTIDGGYITMGRTSNVIDNCFDIWLIKISLNGDKEWDKKFDSGGFFGGCNDYAKSLEQTTDGGYIIGGTFQTSNGWNWWLIKTDTQGNEEWSKSYDADGHSLSGLRAKQTIDEGYILVGWDETEGGSFIIKTDAQGKEEWHKKIIYDGVGYDEPNYFVQVVTDGGYLVVRNIHTSLPNELNIWLIKMDATGNKQWDKTIQNPSVGLLQSISKTSDGGYVFSGTMDPFDNSQAWIMKTDTMGNEQWSQIFSGTKSFSAIYSVQQAKDDGYILSGMTMDPGNGVNSDGLIIKISQLGEKEWQKEIGGSNEDVLYSGQQTMDGNFIFVGSTKSFGAGNNSQWVTDADAWIIKLEN